ncbi:hypothetical protein A2U01_0031022 [Trifolium medium]|uniref:Uncharacterized protein n=1 Tax=Trifolium medium TaxID=97028 RepID=A0A392PCP8_9FABA|nr:hypothetical protein [Trifolium medium]
MVAVAAAYVGIYAFAVKADPNQLKRVVEDCVETVSLDTNGRHERNLLVNKLDKRIEDVEEKFEHFEERLSNLESKRGKKLGGGHGIWAEFEAGRRGRS